MSAVGEYIFGRQNGQMALVARTIGLADLAYNINPVGPAEPLPDSASLTIASRFDQVPSEAASCAL